MKLNVEPLYSTLLWACSTVTLLSPGLNHTQLPRGKRALKQEPGEDPYYMDESLLLRSAPSRRRGPNIYWLGDVVSSSEGLSLDRNGSAVRRESTSNLISSQHITHSEGFCCLCRLFS